MKRLITIFAIFATLSLPLSLAAKPEKPLKTTSPESVGMSHEHLKYADRAIEEAIDKGYIPGAVLAVVRRGYMPYIKSYGKRSTRPEVERMSRNTIFDIASCTKPVVTSIATMKLVEQGRITLWDRVDKYIPNFSRTKLVDSLPQVVRISHLLTHTSGMDAYVSIKRLGEEYDVITRDSLMDYMVNAEISSTPGERFRYSCLNFITLQYIIEQVTGESLRDFAKREIFDPLNMTSTDFIPLDSLGEPLDMKRAKDFKFRRIAPTEVIGDTLAIRNIVHDPLARVVNCGVSGNSGLFSSAADLATLMATLLNEGVYGKHRLLSPLGMKAMRSIPDYYHTNGRALGWDVNSPYSSNKGDLLSFNSFGHTGFTGTSILLDTENEVAIILLTNAIHMDTYRAIEIIHLRSAIANVVAASIID